MPKYRNALPQLSGGLFLTDGGMETTLIFHEGLDLPCFASFTLMKDAAGRAVVRDYYRRYAAMAREQDLGFILETPTWRASADWGDRLGYDADALAKVNRQSVEMLSEIRDEFETGAGKFVISGCLGPRGDGYSPAEMMDPQSAEEYHRVQIRTFRDAGADLITAFTLTYADEAIGLTRAAMAENMPVVISFTLETDGRLPDGQALKDAIRAVDRATENGPAYYMINCAHPSHFAGTLSGDGDWLQRIRGIRANASTMSHSELDNAEELDDGNPHELGRQYRSLLEFLPHANVLGGCCGTDHRHVYAIREACAA